MVEISNANAPQPAVTSFDVTYAAPDVVPQPDVVVDDDAAWRQSHGLNKDNGYDGHAPESKEYK